MKSRRRDQPPSIDTVKYQMIGETGVADPDVHRGDRPFRRRVLKAENLLLARRNHRSR
jgi:hypothetical protein